LGYKTLTALSHLQLRELWHRGVVNPNQFTKDAVVEITDPSNTTIRYFLCKNPDKEIENKETRDTLITKTKEALEKVAASNKKNE
jgi:hypothetical protein